MSYIIILSKKCQDTDQIHTMANKFIMVMSKTNIYLTKKKQILAKLAFTKIPSTLVSITNLEIVFNKILIILGQNLT